MDNVARVRQRVLVRATLVAGLLFGAEQAPAGAQPLLTAMLVDCPDLGEVGRAALEARVRAELASTLHAAGGAITVSCAESSAQVAWHPAAGGTHTRSVALGEDEATNVDILVAAIHDLSTKVQSPAQDPDPSLAPEPGPARTKPPNSLPKTPAHPPAPTPELPSIRWKLLAGIGAELWDGKIGGALGGHLGARAAAPRGWALDSIAGFGTGVNSAQGIRADTFRADVVIERELLARTYLGLGATARILFAQADSWAQPRSHTTATGGLVVSARYELHVGSVGFSVGPDVDVLAQPLAVDVAGAELFRIPRFVAGGWVDVTTDLPK